MVLKKPDRKRGFKKERILRVLLSSSENITKYRIAKEAKVSEPWCREYTSRLEKRNLIRDTKPLDHEGLYSEWEKVHIEANSIEVSFQNVSELLEGTELEYALTTYKAENLLQGFLFPSVIDFYIKEDDREKWLEMVEKKGLIGGGNTRIRLTDEHVLYGLEKIQEFYVVSIPQLILDLRLEGGPCKEASMKLIDRYHRSEENGV